MKNILLATAGLTPQIITETLYALLRREDPFIPDEIHIVTTAEGRHRAALRLLDPKEGHLRRFAEDFGCPGLASALPEKNIHVFTAADGTPLNDIETEEGNAAAADMITSIVRDLTARPETRLHVSIAGGRKTMGFLVGYALSLFGRRQDELSHVLVDPPFEGNPQFFYPPPENRVLFDRYGRPVNTDDANVRLALIPFVRLRGGLPRELLRGHAGYSDVIASAQLQFTEPALEIRLEQRQALFGGVPVPLPPRILAFLCWMARLRHNGGEDGFIQGMDIDALAILECYRKIPMKPAEGARSEHLLRELAHSGGPEERKAWFDQVKSRYHSALRKALGEAGALPYRLTSRGHRPSTRFGLTLEPDSISIG